MVSIIGDFPALKNWHCTGHNKRDKIDFSLSVGREACLVKNLCIVYCTVCPKNEADHLTIVWIKKNEYQVKLCTRPLLLILKHPYSHFYATKEPTRKIGQRQKITVPSKIEILLKHVFHPWLQSCTAAGAGYPAVLWNQWHYAGAAAASGAFC